MTTVHELAVTPEPVRRRSFGRARIAAVVGLVALGTSAWWFHAGSTSLDRARSAHRTAQRSLETSTSDRTNAGYERDNAVTNADTASESARTILDKGATERDNANREADISRQMIAAAVAENGDRYNALRDQANQLIDQTNALVDQVNQLIAEHPEFAPSAPAGTSA